METLNQGGHIRICSFVSSFGGISWSGWGDCQSVINFVFDCLALIRIGFYYFYPVRTHGFNVITTLSVRFRNEEGSWKL